MSIPKACLVALALTVVFATVATAQPASVDAIDLSGDYTGTWGSTTLHQQGDHVSGTYAHDDGEIDGQLDDGRLRFTWREDRGRGRGTFVVEADGTLRGTWGYGDEETGGGDWQLAPMRSGPKAGLELGLRFSWDGQITPNNASMGVIGVGLDLGEHLGRSRWYIGVSGEYELEADMEPPENESGSGMFSRFRGGGEARYYFHDGLAGVSINDGPEEAVPRHDWFGLRGGAESFDGFTHTGEFVDVTYGWDASLGQIALGMCLTAGVSVEPSAVFPGTAMSTTPSTDGAATTTPATYYSPYFALGIHVAL